MSDASRGQTGSDEFVLDCDGHVIEPPKLWAEYTEKRFRNRIPRPARDENGTFGYIVDDRYIMRTASSLAVPPKTADGKLPAGGWDPEQRLRDMDSEGIDIAILYPTLSFFFPEIQDVELHAALCRAYNDWLADYCKADPGRSRARESSPGRPARRSAREPSCGPGHAGARPQPRRRARGPGRGVFRSRRPRASSSRKHYIAAIRVVRSPSKVFREAGGGLSSPLTAPAGI